jgi:hypothetical protein
LAESVLKAGFLGDVPFGQPQFFARWRFDHRVDEVVELDFLLPLGRCETGGKLDCLLSAKKATSMRG